MNPFTASSLPRVLLRWFPEFLIRGGKRLRAQIRNLALSVIVGIVAGLGAIVFYVATHGVDYYALEKIVGYEATPPPEGELSISWFPPSMPTLRPWLLLIVPTLGGLACGFLVYQFAPEAEGHGTDAVISSYHSIQGRIRLRVPLVKTIASALTIGTGGSGGREGPIAQIGAGFGSALAELMHLRPVDRRILLAAGMGAGIAAVFRAPLAGALFAAEVLYRSPEFEPEVILPAAIASVVSYCTFGLFSGWQPLFAMPDLTFHDPRQLGPYFLLMIFMVLLAALYTRSFYGLTRLFKKLPLPQYLRPAVGAFLTGAVGLTLYHLSDNTQTLSVLGFGYNALQSVLQDSSTQTAGILLAVALGKILTTGLTIGSGGSGGVFGPSMVIGGCAGGALGIFLNRLWPGFVPPPASFAVLGMAGFFAAAAKTPFSTLIIVSELTGGYHLLLPALWVCALAYIFSDKVSIYHSQVETRSRSPVHKGRFVREILAEVRVRQMLKPQKGDVPLLRPGDSLDKAIKAFHRSTYPVLPVVDSNHRLLGLVDLEELHLASQSTHASRLILVADMMHTDTQPLCPEDTLDYALELFVENDLLALPIVEDLSGRRYLGMIRRYEIASQYLQRIHPPSRLIKP